MSSIDAIDEQPTPSIPVEPLVDVPIKSNVPEFSNEELAEAEKELEELQRKAALADKPQQSFDSNALGQALAQALIPIMPKPQVPTPIWETDDILNDRKSLIFGITELYKHYQDQFYKERIEPIQQLMDQMRQIIPKLYLRSAEDPNYSQVEKRSQEIVQRWPQIPYLVAAEMAREEISKITKAKSYTVPSHLSSPDTQRQSVIQDEDDSKGPLDFSDIVRNIRAKKGDNI